MSLPDSFSQFIVDQLRALGGVECRRMFGGQGVYHDGVFFGIIHRHRLYFKTSDVTRRKYELHGMGPFRPNARQTLRTYYEVPADVIEDHDRLADWARQAVEVQRQFGLDDKFVT